MIAVLSALFLYPAVNISKYAINSNNIIITNH